MIFWRQGTQCCACRGKRWVWTLTAMMLMQKDEHRHSSALVGFGVSKYFIHVLGVITIDHSHGDQHTGNLSPCLSSKRYEPIISILFHNFRWKSQLLFVCCWRRRARVAQGHRERQCQWWHGDQAITWEHPDWSMVLGTGQPAMANWRHFPSVWEVL